MDVHEANTFSLVFGTFGHLKKKYFLIYRLHMNNCHNWNMKTEYVSGSRVEFYQLCIHLDCKSIIETVGRNWEGVLRAVATNG